jgi:tRNA dimethylallyltransferase
VTAVGGDAAAERVQLEPDRSRGARALPGRVLALVGPTASGKSDVAMAAAERLDAEIVAVDAFTVYRGMDVGTAKPSPEERARVPHHMVDVLDPEQECTVRWFQDAGRTAIADVLARGRQPLLVGGSGLYFRAVVDPLEFPPTDADVRASVEERFAGDAAAAHAVLQRVDPEAAARMDPGNLRRAVRALEVVELTGRKFSDWRKAWDTYDSAYPDLVVVGVDMPRDQLVERIELRTDRMLASGWVEECRELAGRELSSTARQAMGYQEVLDHVAGRCTLDEAAERIKARTRRYAAYQARWFRQDPRVRWRPGEQAVEELVECGS